jgi:hypothetical protein
MTSLLLVVVAGSTLCASAAHGEHAVAATRAPRSASFTNLVSNENR